jgi:hypothetical protein
MTRRDGASELPHSNEGCDHSQGGTPLTPPSIGLAVAESKPNINLNCMELAIERTELMVGEGASRLSVFRLSRHRPDGERRRVPDNRMLWKGSALMRFAPISTINSILSNAAELRLQSLHIGGVPMENRAPMARREWAYELPHSNEGCDQSQGGKTRTPTARGPAVAEINDGSPSELQRLGVKGV